ncbi:carboxymuconolactone decarboxylase family protein [Phenylobacterium sp.]|uniref:carboxymuconolactone decarboxylase family protein n=1 Tax=Phenylobacterium sp. TaxID=1871053 RepID=UPI0035B37FCE
MTAEALGTAGPRIAPVSPDIVDDPLASLFAGVARHYGAPPSVGQRLIANHPRLYRRWLALGSELLTNGELPSDLRELAILRVAHNTGCDYEWRSHGPAAIAAGLPEAMLASWKNGGAEAWPDPRWDAVVDLADALHRSSTVDDRLWDRLATLFSVELILELLVLVGHYTTTAFVLNALRAP